MGAYFKSARSVFTGECDRRARDSLRKRRQHSGGLLLQTYKLPKTATMGGNMLLSKQ